MARMPSMPDLAQPLSRAFGNSAQFWVALQDQYNLDSV